MHEYHEHLPGFDERQIWYDGCAECENRGKDPLYYLGTLDSARLRLAWKRSADWNDDLDIGPVSRAESGLLDTIYRIQVLLQRESGIPMGFLPARDSYVDQIEKVERVKRLLEAYPRGH